MPSFVINVIASSRVLVLNAESVEEAKELIFDEHTFPFAIEGLDVFEKIADEDVNALEQEKKYADQII